MRPLDQMVILLKKFLRKLHNIFHSGYTNLHFQQHCTRVSIFLHPSPHLLAFIFFFFLTAHCRISVPWSGIEPGLETEVWSPNHWTSRELIPSICLFDNSHPDSVRWYLSVGLIFTSRWLVMLSSFHMPVGHFYVFEKCLSRSLHIF